MFLYSCLFRLIDTRPKNSGEILLSALGDSRPALYSLCSTLSSSLSLSPLVLYNNSHLPYFHMALFSGLLGAWSRGRSRLLQFLDFIVKKSNLSLDAKELFPQHPPVFLVRECAEWNPFRFRHSLHQRFRCLVCIFHLPRVYSVEDALAAVPE